MIITNVITLFFGILPSKVIDELTMCTKTYQLAAERAMASMQADGVDRFVSNEYPDSPVAVCLCIDESNKGNKALVAKPYVARCNNGNIVLKALNTDIAMSKKAGIAQEQTFTSIVDEVGLRGAAKINAVTVDGFGVASAVQVMQQTDEIRCGGQIDQNDVVIHSSSIENLTYDYSRGPAGKQRIRVCMMNIFECELKVLINTLLKQQGLKHDATPAQNMYSLSHIVETLRNEFLTLGVISVGGDVRDVDDCPKEVLQMLKKSVDARWISRERGGHELHEMMNVPASDSLIQHTAQYYGGTNSEEWKDMADKCTCINDDSMLSHMLLCCLYLTNHSPNGRKGEGYRNCSRLIACWTSPLQRIATSICGELYSIHIKWAKFADGTSETHKSGTKVISTRMLELATFERSQVFYLYELLQDWRTLLPRSAALLIKESRRAVRLGLCKEEQNIVDHIDTLMKQGMLSVLNKTHYIS